MDERYPGYDVLAKRNTPSWNVQTRRVIDRRLAVPREPRFFSQAEFRTLEAIAARIVPQPPDRPPVPVAALIDDRMVRQQHDGYRPPHMPRDDEAWKLGLRAIDAEAEALCGAAFHRLHSARKDEVLQHIERGGGNRSEWGGMPSRTFFHQRLVADIVRAYWSHPAAWSEIGWGGPASPRGYVRMGYDRRDPWEAVEAHPHDYDATRKANRRVG
ncbi:MAG TPA: gluconate 2-dehydrogenase subunit 3 family protein [Rhodopila sp.]|uniref:gluconate 2-dehydrogenase subunit 3 family protein n=1 Tax=Rhodopila sp. TaxID=2480087 RepID=UPI002B928EDD|nr:gluconate 2-dehydrogenase subunit 3 family protein [Rhodopila sp.]HVY13967.1 gluconate 2-dehydrogenase subunit 3 family protein [Rhodopila sp.]